MYYLAETDPRKGHGAGRQRGIEPRNRPELPGRTFIRNWERQVQEACSLLPASWYSLVMYPEIL